MLKLSVRIYCRSERMDKKGNSDLVFIVTPPGVADQERVKFPTGEKCKPKAWDQEKQMLGDIYGQEDALNINNRLDAKRKKLVSIIEANNYNLKSEGIQKIREKFAEFVEAYRQASGMKTAVPSVIPETKDFEKFWTREQKQRFLEMSPYEKSFYLINESIIKAHRKDWAAGYVKRFRTMHTKFFLFDPEFTVEKLSVPWWREFVSFCVDELDNSNNTINTDAKVIQRLVLELKERGFVLPKGLDEISWKYIEPDVMSISWDKVLKLANLDLSDHHKGTYNDSRILWLLGAFTGRRWSEIERMSEKNFYKDTKGRWRYKSVGKGLKPVDLPLIPEAVEFLKKIKFIIPRHAQQTVNRDIKEVARIAGLDDEVMSTRIVGKEITEELVPEWKTIHIHTGRHSYAMRIVDLSAGKPHAEKFVSFMLGHASHATTWKYLNRRASSHDQMFDEIYTGKTETSLLKLMSEYKHENKGDLFTLLSEVGEKQLQKILLEAKGRKIELHSDNDKGIDDPPISWRYITKVKAV